MYLIVFTNVDKSREVIYCVRVEMEEPVEILSGNATGQKSGAARTADHRKKCEDEGICRDCGAELNGHLS